MKSHLLQISFSTLSLVIITSLPGSAAFAQQVSGDYTIVNKQYSSGYLGLQFDIYNNGTRVPTELAYGFRTTYNNTARGQTTYDIANAFHSVWDAAPGPAGGQVFGVWVIAEGPKDASNRYGVVGQEIDFVNRGDDTGWTASRGSLARFSAGLQVAPESNTFTHGGLAQNVTADIVIGQSPGPRPDGKFVRAYNGLLMEPNAIAAGGRAITITGDTTSQTPSSASTPFAVAQFFGNFLHGFDSIQATFFDNIAYRLSSSQKLGWFRSDGSQAAIFGSDDAGDLILQPSGTGSIKLYVNGDLHSVIIGAPNTAGPGLRSLAIAN